jgi:hypothetical protein
MERVQALMALEDQKLILLKNSPFILRESQDERGVVEIIGDLPFMLSSVEAVLGFFGRIEVNG